MGLEISIFYLTPLSSVPNLNFYFLISLLRLFALSDLFFFSDSLLLYSIWLHLLFLLWITLFLSLSFFPSYSLHSFPFSLHNFLLKSLYQYFPFHRFLLKNFIIAIGYEYLFLLLIGRQRAWWQAGKIRPYKFPFSVDSSGVILPHITKSNNLEKGHISLLP